MLLFPSIFDPEKIIAAQSTRLGGVSKAPFDSLNLGLSVQDKEEDVLQNRTLFFNALGIANETTARVHQVHGDRIYIAEKPGLENAYDAQITQTKGLYLLVSIADCTPVLIHDEHNNAIAAIHAGWRGSAAEIVRKTLEQMQRHFGTEGKWCKAFIGACIGFDTFEVGAEVADNFSSPFKRFDSGKQKWFVDLKSANKAQLLQFGIPDSSIEVSDQCTVRNNDRFFSHRKENGNTGRMMAVIGMK